MTQETLTEVDSVQAPEVTATSEPQLDTPADAEQQPVEKKPDERLFTQAELDEMLDRRFKKERRKWEREQQAKFANNAQAPKEVPPVDQFESPEAYAEALAVKKAEELVAQRELQRQQAELLEAYHEREEQAREKYDDFEQVAYNPKVPITQVMAETIRASEIGPDVAYYLGANLQEAARISRLSPFLQAKEIGKLEAKLADNPPIRSSSTAPAPITPVTARASGNPAYDTTDPRSTKTMTTSQWIEAERARQIRKMQTQLR